MLLPAHADGSAGGGPRPGLPSQRMNSAEGPFPRTVSPLRIISGKISEDNDACMRLSAKAKNDMT